VLQAQGHDLASGVDILLLHNSIQMLV
jgi:hypothetical protein